MAILQQNRFSQYRWELELLVNALKRGLKYFTTFVNKSYSCIDVGDEIEYISNILKPIADATKDHFDRMKKCGNDMRKKVKEDFEKYTNTVEYMKQEMKCKDADIASLTEELKGKERDVTEAQRQLDTKQNNLLRAENSLAEARKKLDGAEMAQVATEAVGYTTAGVCLAAAIIFPPAWFGVAAGTSTGIVGSTALRAATKDCEHCVKHARNEVLSSEKQLEDAKQNKTSTEQLLRNVSLKKGQVQDNLLQTQKVLEELVEIQKDIIIMDENIKKLYTNLCGFHGHFDVLHFETRGGYSTSLLRNLTLDVCESVSKLLTCNALHFLCDQLRLNEIVQQLHQIQSIKWPGSITDQDEDDLLSLV